MVRYEAIPHLGIGPLRLGMSRAEARAHLSGNHKSFRKAVDSTHETDAFDECGFHVYYEDTPETVVFVEVFPVDGVSFILHGVDVFGNTAANVLHSLKNTAEIVEEERGSSYLLAGADVSLWRSHVDESHFESLGVGAEGYY